MVTDQLLASPDVLSATVDPDKYELSWRTVLDSLQDANINR